MEVAIWGATRLRTKLVERGVAVIERGHPAVVLVQLAEVRDLEYIKHLRERQPRIPIVVQVGDDPDLALRAVELGALGVVDRDVPVATVIEAFAAAMEGHTFTTQAAARLLIQGLERRQQH